MHKNLKRTLYLCLLGSISAFGTTTIGMAQDVNGNDSGGVLNISTGTYDYVYGKLQTGSETEISGGNISISGDAVIGFVYGGAASNNTSTVYNNQVTISGSAQVKNVYGGGGYANHKNNHVIIEGNAVILGNNGAGGVYGGISDDMTKTTTVSNNTVVIRGNAQIQGGDVYGGNGSGESNTVTIEDNTSVDGKIYGGQSIYGNTNKNIVNINNGTVHDVFGGLSLQQGTYGNSINLRGNSKILGDVYAGYGANNTTIEMNTITLQGNADVSQANLYGSNLEIDGENVKNNTLIVDGWSGTAKSLHNFSDITFQNIKWNSGGTVLQISDDSENSLANTKVNVDSISFSGGGKINKNDSMTFIKGMNLGLQKDNVTFRNEFTAGVTAVGSGVETVTGDTISYTITDVKANNQINLVAENRAVAAAFVNQGSDLVNDALNSLSDDSHYGTKTFAATYGNHSKYDVNSDLKINGWSTIVGVGNKHKVTSGDFSWGIFYENGTGNYRTFNSFNNEFFRGDGSLVYNGGGIAARLKQNSGWYYEASFRAGTLKSDMDNALMDGAGRTYGYDSESTYYGAHVGVGKIRPIGTNSELDLYGKFFHTYVEDDSFTIADDRFSFDSVTSDRLRVGAAVRTNKDHAWSTYYGLAYEYEFNGDADMTAGQFAIPSQSLQGSTVIGEIGWIYNVGSNSPWKLDLGIAGYAGQREGGSLRAQVTYTF